MRQVTGSNNTPKDKIVSIRFTSDGDSFSLPSIDEREPISSIYLLSHSSILVPAEEVEKSGAAAVMESCGVGLTPHTAIIELESTTIKVADGIEARVLIAAPKEQVEQFHNHFGEDALYTSPLLIGAIESSNHAILCHREGLAYIKIFTKRGELLLAEVFKAPTPQDVIYWMAKVDEATKLKRLTIYVSSDNDMAISELSNHFKRVIPCEL